VDSGDTEEELWKNGTAHIIKVHATEDAHITPQFKEITVHKIFLIPRFFGLCKN